jgi:iron complex outermembrane recepter protein
MSYRKLLLPLVCAGRTVLADEAPVSLPQVNIWGQVQALPPSDAVADVGSPQSAVSSEVIHEIASPVGDFGTVANFTPSYVSSAPNGPGFDAAKNQTLRGFVDGQFNVTLDGIPFADPDNFQHHSTSYFPTSMMDRLVMDRSPGTAADLGYASFGGSMNLYTAAIPEKADARAYASYGSFATSLTGAMLNSASPQASGQSGLMAMAQYMQSDGAMTYSAGYKGDALIKAVTLIGDARLTAFYTYDHYRFYNAGSVTTTDIGIYGPSYGYNNDPTSPNYYRYADTEREADFGYLKLEDAFGSWRLENKLYTYSYRNTGLSLKGDQTSSSIGGGFPGLAPTDIAGRSTDEDYRTVGNDVRILHGDPYGTLLFGVWLEHSWQTEERVAEDLTTGQLYDANKADGSPVYFDFDAHLDTVQPYAQYSWRVTDAWLVQTGLRYRDVVRDFDASVVQNFHPGTDGTVTKSVPSMLPSVDTTYRLNDTTNVYAQVAKGSLVPSQAFFYTANPAKGNQAGAEEAWAEQFGIVRQTYRYGVGLDAYNINFNNYVSTIVQDGDTFYINSGKVLYRGVEAEAHINIGCGVSAVANASLPHATFQQPGMTSNIQGVGDTIPFAPSYTGLAGFVYGSGIWGASILAKFVGTEYQGKNGSADGGSYRVNAYSYTNATVTRNFTSVVGNLNARLELALNNLWNSSAVTDNAGPSIAGPNLVNVLPRRNLMMSVIADL